VRRQAYVVRGYLHVRQNVTCNKNEAGVSLTCSATVNQLGFGSATSGITVSLGPMGIEGWVDQCDNNDNDNGNKNIADCYTLTSSWVDDDVTRWGPWAAPRRPVSQSVVEAVDCRHGGRSLRCVYSLLRAFYSRLSPMDSTQTSVSYYLASCRKTCATFIFRISTKYLSGSRMNSGYSFGCRIISRC